MLENERREGITILLLLEIAPVIFTIGGGGGDEDIFAPVARSVCGKVLLVESPSQNHRRAAAQRPYLVTWPGRARPPRRAPAHSIPAESVALEPSRRTDADGDGGGNAGSDFDDEGGKEEEEQRCFCEFPTRNHRFPLLPSLPSVAWNGGGGGSNDFLQFKGMKRRWARTRRRGGGIGGWWEEEREEVGPAAAVLPPE